MKKIVGIGFFLFLIVYNEHIVAQEMVDSTVSSSSWSALRSQFVKSTGPSSYLYNGTAYTRYWNGVRGFPFFLSESFQNGKLLYSGITYHNVALMYDISRDELVIPDFSKEVNIKLIPEKIALFSIGSHEFVRLNGDSLSSGLLYPGFYERIYNGTVIAYIKHEKKIERSARAEDNFSQFTLYASYYLWKDGIFHPVEGEKGLISIFKDNRQEIRKFLGKKEINYKKDPRGTIVQVAAFYDGLKK